MKTIKEHLLIIIVILSISACGEAGMRFSGTKSDKLVISESDAAFDEEKSLSKKEERPDNPNPKGQNNESGLLTAGEWNDIEHWDFWKNLMNDSSEFKAMEEYWGFCTKGKKTFQITDENGKAVNGLKIEIKNENGQIISTCMTDVLGNAELFINIFEKNKGHVYAEISAKGKKLKTVKTLKEVNKIQINTNYKAENEVEIAFVVDATGSMGDELEFLKNELNDIIRKYQKNSPAIKVRTSLLFYRDKGDDYLTKNFDFESDLSILNSNLNKQFAGGGGDYEEAVDEALYVSLNKNSWNENAKTKLLFLILDAPPHYNPETISKIKETIRRAVEKGIKIIPVAASGIDKNTEFLLRFFSIATNGTYVFLTDDSGIGNSHLKPTTGKYEVEFLNNLILRLIMKYSGVQEL